MIESVTYFNDYDTSVDTEFISVMKKVWEMYNSENINNLSVCLTRHVLN